MARTPPSNAPVGHPHLRRVGQILRAVWRRAFPPPPASMFMAENPAYSKFKVGVGTYGFPTILFADEGVGRLSIGRYCSIADGVKIFLAGEHHVGRVTTYPFDVLRGDGRSTTKGPVSIANDVWIGLNVTVLSGVSIGDGAVIGASSVVSRSIPPYATACGVPARVVRMRFQPEVVDALLRTRWWDWPPNKIAEALPLLCGDVTRFMETFGVPRSEPEARSGS